MYYFYYIMYLYRTKITPIIYTRVQIPPNIFTIFRMYLNDLLTPPPKKKKRNRYG